MSLLAFAALLLPGISFGQIKNPGTYVYAIAGDVDSLDPDWAFDGISQEAQFQIYETLVFYKGSSVDEFEPMLSTVVPDRDNGNLSEDGLRYAFPIRRGVKFHDGTLLTPEDVKYSLMRFLLTDRAGGPSFLLLEPLLGIADVPAKDGKPDSEIYKRVDKAITVEGNAVVIRLQAPYQPLLSVLAGYAPVVSKKWVVANGGWDGTLAAWPKFFDPKREASPLFDREAGTGPFKLERWDKENKQLVLSRNENYWRAPAKLKLLVLKTVNEPSARKLLLQAGDADEIVMDREFLPMVDGLPGVTVQDGLPLLETHAAFVMTLKTAAGSPYVGSGKLDGDGISPEFFSDIHIRRGFAKAFDYDAYIRDGYRGKAQRARGPLPKGVFGYDPNQPVHAYDPAKAAEEFKAAFGGQVWDKGFRLTISFVEGFADRQLACQIMKKGVESLNPKFRVEVRALQQSTWLAQYTAKQIPISNARWALDYPDANSPAFAFLHSKGYYAASSGYSNPRADRWIEQAKGELDRDKRRQDYHELQSIAYQDAPQIYTVDTYYAQVLRAWVKGRYYNPIVLYGYFYPVSKES